MFFIVQLLLSLLCILSYCETVISLCCELWSEYFDDVCLFKDQFGRDMLSCIQWRGGANVYTMMRTHWLFVALRLPREANVRSCFRLSGIGNDTYDCCVCFLMAALIGLTKWYWLLIVAWEFVPWVISSIISIGPYFWSVRNHDHWWYQCFWISVRLIVVYSRDVLFRIVWFFVGLGFITADVFVVDCGRIIEGLWDLVIEG